MFLIGHVSRDLVYFGARAESEVVQWASRLLFYLLPNLEVFNWKNQVVYEEARSLALISGGVGYLLSYCAAVMALACLLFSRKDLK